MKALACLLIANFHSDILFPNKLSLLAFGGDIGNNIFFMISGFTLLPSVEKSASTDIGKWYLKRIIRLMPTISFFYILTFFTGGIIIRNFSDMFQAFIFPSIYWFTGALFFFYLFFFMIEKYSNPVFRIICSITLIALHLYKDNLFVERYFIGFISMMCGAWIRRNFHIFSNKIKGKKLVFGITLCGVFYLILKLLRGRNIETFGLIHLSIGMLTICLAMGILLLGILHEDNLNYFFLSHTKLYQIIKKLSEITLAVYLIMGLNDRIIMQAIKKIFPFPISYVVNMSVSLFIAYIITLVDLKLRRKNRKVLP